MKTEHVGQALRRLRQLRGLKPVQVAARSGCSKAQVSAYERGRRLPWLTTLAPLLDALEAGPRDLVRAGEHVKRHLPAE